jgi:hypothetical protein
MNQFQQIDCFACDIDALIHRYRSEFDLSVAAVIGVLEMTKLDIYRDDLLTPLDDDDDIDTNDNHTFTP